MLQRERLSGPGCQSGAPVALVALRAHADLPAVRSGVGETRSVCASLRRGQRCVLVSVSGHVIQTWAHYKSESRSFFPVLACGFLKAAADALPMFAS